MIASSCACFDQGQAGSINAGLRFGWIMVGVSECEVCHSESSEACGAPAVTDIGSVPHGTISPEAA